MTQLLSELYECFHISSSLMASLDYKSDVRRIERCKNERLDAEEQAEVIFNKFIQLKDLFEACFTTGVERQLHMEFRYNDPNAVIDSLRHENMLKEREIEGLKHCKKELEAHKEVANDMISKKVDSIMEENCLLLISNNELRKQNMALHDH